MKKNKLLIAIGAAVLVGIVSLLIYRAQNNPTSDNVIRIGVINPITGPLSEYGKKMMSAMKMAQNEINASTNKAYKVELVFEDAKSLPRDTVNAFHKIKSSDVDALIVTGDLSVSTIQSMIGDFRRPCLAVASAHDIPVASEWLFRCSLPVTLGSEVLAKYALYRKVSKVGVICINCQTGIDASKKFRHECEKRGIAVCSEELYDANLADLRTQVTKALQQQPDAVYIFGFGPGYVSALNNVLQQQFKGIVLTHYEITSEQSNIVKHGDGCFYSDIDFGEGTKNMQALNYCEKYKKTYGVDSDALSAFTYEAVRLLSTAAEKARTLEAHGLRNSLLATINYPSVVGEISYDSNGEIGLRMFVKEKRETDSVVVTWDAKGDQ